MAQGSYSLSLRDYSNEISSVQVNIGTVTLLNFAALLTAMGNFKTAADGITLGVLASDIFVASGGPLSASVPTDKNAQVEDKWLIVYHDNTQFLDDPVNAIPNPGWQKIFRNELPTPDRTLVVNHTDYVDLTAGAVATFVTAFQALVKSPYGGDSVIDYIKYVGR